MSYDDGMAALNLEMPDRVPRTEYSAESHWELIEKVTGIKVNAFSSEIIKKNASKKFMEAWNYDFIWNILIHNQIFGEKKTKMGHAKYAAEGVDFNSQISTYFKEPEDVIKFDPWEAYGKRDKVEIIKSFEKHYEDSCAYNNNAVNMTGIYVTCMSGLIEILGWDMLLCTAGLYQKEFGELTNRYVSWMQQYFDALAESNVPVVMVHDDITWTAGAFIHPDWYRKFIFPNYKKYFKPLIESGKKIIFTSDGNYTEFIDDIADCGINGFVLEPTTDMKYIAEKYGKTHSFIGNVDTRILLSGTKEQIRSEVKRCMDIGKSCPGFFMAVGNHIPANTPVENAIYYNEVYEEMGRR